MHICATNICVWIRTLVLESLKELTIYFQRRQGLSEDGLLDSIRSHTLQHAGTVLGTHSGPHPEWEPIDLRVRDGSNDKLLSKALNSSARAASKAVYRSASYIAGDGITTQQSPENEINDLESTTLIRKLKKYVSTTVASTISSTLPSTTTTRAPTTISSTTTTTTTTAAPPTTLAPLTQSSTLASSTIQTIVTDAITTPSTPASVFNNPLSGMENAFQTFSGLSHNETHVESLDTLFPQALYDASPSPGTNLSCGRVNIMGTIVQDSAPYLYPFIIEYSLIGKVTTQSHSIRFGFMCVLFFYLQAPLSFTWCGNILDAMQRAMKKIWSIVWKWCCRVVLSQWHNVLVRDVLIVLAPRKDSSSVYWHWSHRSSAWFYSLYWSWRANSIVWPSSLPIVRTVLFSASRFWPFSLDSVGNY